jgi:hypothetical protein
LASKLEKGDGEVITEYYGEESQQHFLCLIVIRKSNINSSSPLPFLLSPVYNLLYESSNRADRFIYRGLCW